jgi:hypothetical protein
MLCPAQMLDDAAPYHSRVRIASESLECGGKPPHSKYAVPTAAVPVHNYTFSSQGHPPQQMLAARLATAPPSAANTSPENPRPLAA